MKKVVVISPGQGPELHIMRQIPHMLNDLNIPSSWCVLAKEENEISDFIGRACRGMKYEEVIVIVSDFSDNSSLEAAKAAVKVAAKNIPNISVWAVCGSRRRVRAEDGVRYFYRISFGHLDGKREAAAIVWAIKQEFEKEIKGGLSREDKSNK